MAGNWKKYKLEEIGEIVGGGTPSTTNPLNFNGNIPWLTPKDLTGYNFKHIKAGERFISNEGLKNSGAKLMPKGTVLMSSRAPIGYLAIAENELCTNQGFKSIICNKDICHNYFIYYLLKNNIDKLHQIATGTTFLEVSGSALKNFEITLPPLPEQQAIAEILSSLDDKIELNLQTNKTLEEMANALYKHWFVDFGPFLPSGRCPQDGRGPIPGFVESELGLIPEGWEVKGLKAVAEIIMGQSPESKYYNENGEGLPFHQGVSDYGIRFPSDRVYSTEGNRFAQDGDILFSVRAPVGKINIAKHKIILGRGLAAIRDNSNNNNFLFCSIRNQFKTLDSIGSGTVYNSVNKSDMEKINILTPPDKIKQAFNDIVKDLDTQYFNNDSENIILKQTRDYLLPKLISGEIQVKDAEAYTSRPADTLLKEGITAKSANIK